jgi:membrane-associated protease RseP (regulator of RpoE activity)
VADPDPRREARDIPAPGESAWPSPSVYHVGDPIEPRVRVRPPDRVWRHWLLLAITFLTTTAVGALHYASFLADFGAVTPPLSSGLLLRGLWYSLTILAILGCHEMGHYLACRYYRVDASLPYFLPAPILTGTLGAFIRIREPFPNKRVLFDVGVAGPIAGFVVAVPALFIGLALSRVAPLPPHFSGLSLGEPLLFKWAAWLVWGDVPAGQSVNLHPMAFAAWFGLLATALNLFPIGQLDGGHISYAVLGRRSTLVTVGAVLAAMVLTYFSSSWFVWTMLVVAMLVVFGPRHPRTPDEHQPLPRGRIMIAVLALVIFVLCFTPAPIEVIELLPR